MAKKKAKLGAPLGLVGQFGKPVKSRPHQSLVSFTAPRPVPARPPSGYYDPAIDSQVAAGGRGLGDLRIDVDTAKRRGLEDYRSTLFDLDTTRDRTLQDYGTATGNLNLNFQRLGRQQGESARARGVMSEGIAAKSAAVRGANQGREQAGLDTQRDRSLADIQTRRTLLDRDYARQFASGGDMDLQLTRAEREQPFLEADANTQRLFQANQAGYLPPTGKVRFGPKPPKPRKKNRMVG